MEKKRSKRGGDWGLREFRGSWGGGAGTNNKVKRFTKGI